MSIADFQGENPSPESCWRSIILFGKNTASYKFALARALLELASGNKHGCELSLEEIAPVYSRFICEHISSAPRQCTGSTSSFLDACKHFNAGIITASMLNDAAVKYGFNHVIDAFHNVNGSAVPFMFYEKNCSRGRKSIILTDGLYSLNGKNDLDYEAEARWHLVETAWSLSLPVRMLEISYDGEGSMLYAERKGFARRNIAHARDALNGYQKGKCFYCGESITVTSGQDNTCEVSHFFPFMLQPYMPDINLNGVWNLVLACHDCGRKKYANIPEQKYIERLYRRNEFLIESHHPLRETLISQTGKTPEARRNFLKEAENTLWSLRG